MTGPLRLPAFRYLLAARAVSYVGTYLAPIAVAFAVLHAGGGTTALGLAFAGSGRATDYRQSAALTGILCHDRSQPRWL